MKYQQREESLKEKRILPSRKMRLCFATNDPFTVVVLVPIVINRDQINDHQILDATF